MSTTLALLLLIAGVYGLLVWFTIGVLQWLHDLDMRVQRMERER